MHFESQKNDLRQLTVISKMFETWDVQKELHRILSNQKVESTEQLYWRFDGFGEPIPFTKWMKEFDHFYSNPPKTEINHTWLIHDELDDFHSRLRTYQKLFDVSLEVLENDSTLSRQKNTGLKILIQKCIPKLFDLQGLWADSFSMANLQEIRLSVFPNGGQVTVDIKKTGSIETLRGSDGSDLAHLFVRFGLNYNKFNIEDAIQNLSMHRDLLMKYFERLDQENSEISNLISNEGVEKDDDIVYFDLDAIEKFDDDDIDDFDFDDDDDDIDDFDFDDDDDEDVILFEGTVGDLDEESQESIKLAVNDNLADDVYVGREQDEEKSLNQKVMEKFNLTMDDWEQLSYEDRQKLRDVYKNLD